MGGFNVPMFVLFLLLSLVAGVIIIYWTSLPLWAGLLLAPVVSFTGLFAFGWIVDFVEGRKMGYAPPAPFSGLLDKGQDIPAAPKGLTCPSCGSNNIAAILYGLPGLNDALERAIKSGQVTLGGCGIYDGAPEWVCNNCAQKFGEIKLSVDE